MTWKFWQRQENQLPKQKSIIHEEERRAWRELPLDDSHLREMHDSIEGLGKLDHISPMLWSTSKLSGRVVLERENPSPGKPEGDVKKAISYPSAALLILFVSYASDGTASKSEFRGVLDRLADLSDVGKIANQKTHTKASEQLKRFIDVESPKSYQRLMQMAR